MCEMDLGSEMWGEQRLPGRSSPNNNRASRGVARSKPAVAVEVAKAVAAAATAIAIAARTTEPTSQANRLEGKQHAR